MPAPTATHPTRFPDSFGERLAMIETTVYGRDGRGGIVDDVDQINAKVDKLIRAAVSVAVTFLTATASIVAGILTHSL